MFAPSKKKLARLIESGDFDADWYRRTYPDVDSVGMDPALHYMIYGRIMGRDPSPDFPTEFYRTVFQISENHEPVTRIADLRSTGRLSANRKTVLASAYDVARLGSPDLAARLAEKHLPSELAYSANILRANAAIASGDELTWLHHANLYLSHFGVSPVTLQGEGELFQRLYSRAGTQITDGPLISVLMPAFNAEHTIRMAVQSLLNQSWRNLELLVVDDCSQDRTWPILQELAANDARLRIFRNDINAGPFVSKNIALSQATGEWITGHDADDWAHPERLERQVRFCIEKNQMACMSGMLRMAGDGSFVRLNKIGGFVHDGACRSGFISLMIRGQYLRDVLGSWDTVRMGADSEFLRRIQQAEGKDVKQLPTVTMICYDNPDGLTNHATLGYSENGSVSPHRIQYRKNYTTAHENRGKTELRFSFPRLDADRPFPAPSEMLNAEGVEGRLLESYISKGVEFNRSIKVNVAIVTNLSFPGGNTSSTLDEIKFFVDRGLQVALIHCPVDSMLGAPFSPRYDRWKKLISHWSEISRVDTTVLICRHPRVASSKAFGELGSKIHAETCFFVKNNSSLQTDGSSVYDMDAAFHAAKNVNSSRIIVCPISSVMRSELEQYKEKTGVDIAIASDTWTPTFNLSLYKHPPKMEMRLPFRIGRHGRDGREKWHEDPIKLLQIFPEKPDFQISILGGAKSADKILNGRPSNWLVHEFGEIEPHEFLANLDAFVYFPNTGLSEAFGRTIVEAMLASVPVILPQSFVHTFDDLPLYCSPSEVEGIVRRLADSDPVLRAQYLSEVQEIAINRYSSSVIADRMRDTGLPGMTGVVSGRKEMSEASRDFRRSIGGS